MRCFGASLLVAAAVLFFYERDYYGSMFVGPDALPLVAFFVDQVTMFLGEVLPIVGAGLGLSLLFERPNQILPPSGTAKSGGVVPAK